MAGNAPDGLADDFFEQILTGPSYTAGPGDAVFIGEGEENLGGGGPMGLRLGSGSRGGGADDVSDQAAVGAGRYSGLGSISMGMPLGLNLEQAFLKPEDASGTGNSSAIAEREGSVHPTNMFPVFGQPESSLARLPAALPVPAAARTQPPLHSFHNQTTPGGAAVVPHQPAVRPRVRARRGQATDPHSIAERLRRERIAERMKILQELVPSANKTDRATMLDDIVDYVKFLRLQVKVLSMSRLGGAGAVAQLVADVPLSSSIEGEGGEGGNSQHAWDNWSADGTEQQVAKLMEEDVGAAMQFLQSKKLCIMPISLATAIFPGAVHQQLDMPPTLVKPESNASP